MFSAGSPMDSADLLQIYCMDTYSMTNMDTIMCPANLSVYSWLLASCSSVSFHTYAYFWDFWAFKKDDQTMLGRKELFRNTLRKAAHAWKRMIKLHLSEEEAKKLRFFVDEPAYTDLHWGMFIPVIKMQGTEEQQWKCPTLTSSKWWPGGLGKVSTHAIVFARLITNGQDHGINGFIVQLRSLDDHLPLPGITIGDIGMKFGSGAYNTMDNGVLRFERVRIPRDQMLTRLCVASNKGRESCAVDVPRWLLYGTMVHVRRIIVADASSALSNAVCIATRYSAVIDYRTQQSRLFPLLASAYAFRFVGEWLKWLYSDVTKRLHAGDFSTLPEAHACTAGLKSLTTSFTAVVRHCL
ncbi:acyl-coenzyme A oxidase [Dionaea muscipula]